VNQRGAIIPDEINSILNYVYVYQIVINAKTAQSTNGTIILNIQI